MRTGWYRCIICRHFSNGWGNNPAPLKKRGRCCDVCNTVRVIPARVMMMMRHKDQNDTGSEEREGGETSGEKG